MDNPIQNEIAAPKAYGARAVVKGNHLNLETPNGDSNINIAGFSLTEAIMADVNGMNRSREILEEFQARTGAVAHRGGVMIPEVMLRADERQNTVDDRDLVAEDHLAGSFIDMLRAKPVVNRAGCRVVQSAGNTVAVPRQNASTTAYWVPESGAPVQSVIGVDQISLSPSTVAGYTDVSRRLMIQADPSIDAMIRSDLQMTLKLAKDKAYLNGSGTNNEPLGLLNVTGAEAINVVSCAGAYPDWSELVEADTAIRVANAEPKVWVMHPVVFNVLRATPKVAGEADMIAENDGKLLGYPVLTTTQMPTDRAILGDWEQSMEVQWGLVEITSDVYSLSTTGATRITAFHDVAFAARQPSAFTQLQFTGTP